MFLQKTLTTYEDWPKAIVTKQTYSECAFILRGTDRGRPAWHCILVPASQIADLNAHPQNTTADITKFGSIIQYLNNRDQIILTSGWGIDPPRMIQEWIEEHYTSDFNTDTPAVSISNEIFCAIHWENNSIVSTVPQSAIFKSPEFTNVNDICFIEAEGQYRKGQIIFIGSRRDCEKLKTSSIVSGISIAFSMLTDSFLRKRQNTLDSTANPKLGTTYDKSVPVFDTNTTLSSQQSPQV
ncbi:unnamed protein product [Rotaria sp. Silwood1]|nr:unnamed protein product [Rotaria sp. Silwood1]CAF4763078.1 unnamed protein product [Rotaria sp. Silwood1]